MSDVAVTVIPGYAWQDGDTLTDDIIRSLGMPVVSVAVNIDTASVADGSITTVKLADGALSADATGLGKMADGYLTLPKIAAGIFTADTAGRAPFAANWLTVTLVNPGTFIPTPLGRGPFASGLVNATMMQVDAVHYGVGSGTGAAMIVTVSPTIKSYVDNSGTQVFSAYWDGLLIAFKAPANCTAGATLKESSLGLVFGMYRLDGTAVQANDILGASIVEMRFNTSLNTGAGGWQLTTPPATPVVVFARAGSFGCVGLTATVVAFSTAVANTNYSVATSLTASSSGSTANAVLITAKTVNGFTATQEHTDTNTYDYIVVPHI